MISFVIAVILIGVGIIGAYFAFQNFKSKKKQKSLIGSILAGVCALLLLIVPMSFHTVEAGEIAVVKNLGKAEKVRTAGTYFDLWITKTYSIYDAKVQNLEVKTQAYSKDAQTMDVAMTVQYQIDATKAIEIANKYGSIDVLANRIESIATEKTKSTLSSYSAMNIIETRSTISPQVEEIIKATVDEEYYVNIVAVVLTNIDFSDAFEKTVEDKMIAEQEKLKAQYEKETAIVNAEKELEVAKLAAQAKIESAKADAQAQIEVAKAEAMAIQLKSIEVARALGFTINEKLVTGEDGATAVEYTIDFAGKTTEEIQLITDYMKYLEYLAKWDGKLPTVVAGESATIMIPTPSLGENGTTDNP
jgi:regulator of protease activity HflC (stomatin/prohibitin superfamily)